MSRHFYGDGSIGQIGHINYEETLDIVKKSALSAKWGCKIARTKLFFLKTIEVPRVETNP